MKIRADWTAVTGATGYKVQWSTASTFATKSEGTVSSGSTTNYTINPTPALTANTRYYVRVLPTKDGADEPPSDTADIKTHATGNNATVDYDADNDGLIEITTLAQLNGVRYDLDGDGEADKYDSNNDGDYVPTPTWASTTTPPNTQPPSPTPKTIWAATSPPLPSPATTPATPPAPATSFPTTWISTTTRPATAPTTPTTTAASRLAAHRRYGLNAQHQQPPLQHCI